MSVTLEKLESDIQQRVDELTPELLPRVLEVFLARDSLVGCARHSELLGDYVRSQIALTKAKRYFARGDTNADGFLQALLKRDKVQKIYRDTPCTCWVSHR